MGKDTKFVEDDLLLKGFKKNADGRWSKPGASVVDVRRIAQSKPEKRKSKYGVSPVEERTHKGTVYMSKAEMQYRKYLDTKILIGEVISYSEQVPFQVVVNDKNICVYKLDFEVKYKDRIEYVDVKGVKTAIYSLKKKLVEAQFGIKITEIKKEDF